MVNYAKIINGIVYSYYYNFNIIEITVAEIYCKKLDMIILLIIDCDNHNVFLYLDNVKNIIIT